MFSMGHTPKESQQGKEQVPQRRIRTDFWSYGHVMETRKLTQNSNKGSPNLHLIHIHTSARCITCPVLKPKDFGGAVVGRQSGGLTLIEILGRAGHTIYPPIKLSAPASCKDANLSKVALICNLLLVLFGKGQQLARGSNTTLPTANCFPASNRRSHEARIAKTTRRRYMGAHVGGGGGAFKTAKGCQSRG